MARVDPAAGMEAAQPFWGLEKYRSLCEGGWLRELTGAFTLFGGRRGKSKGLEQKVVKQCSDEKLREAHPCLKSCLAPSTCCGGIGGY